MNKNLLNKFAVAAGMALALSVGQAVAAPAFGITQSGSGGTYLGPNNVPGTQFNGNSSELLRFSPDFTNVIVNSGFISFNGIFNAGTSTTTLINANSGTGTYGLYVLFNFDSTYNAGLSTGAPGTAGSQYVINNLNFTFYSDRLGDTTFQSASSPSTEGARTGNFSDDILLAFGNLNQPGSLANIAGFNTGGGAFVNSLENFFICSGAGTATIGGATTAGPGCLTNNGTQYFSNPVPFFPLAFDAFNNTGNSLAALDPTTRTLAITQAIGAVSFQAVPEPSSIALFGIAALALGVSARRRRKN